MENDSRIDPYYIASNLQKGKTFDLLEYRINTSIKLILQYYTFDLILPAFRRICLLFGPRGKKSYQLLTELINETFCITLQDFEFRLKFT